VGAVETVTLDTTYPGLRSTLPHDFAERCQRFARMRLTLVRAGTPGSYSSRL